MRCAGLRDPKGSWKYYLDLAAVSHSRTPAFGGKYVLSVEDALAAVGCSRRARIRPRRSSAAGSPDECHNLAAVYVEGDVVDRTYGRTERETSKRA